MYFRDCKTLSVFVRKILIMTLICLDQCQWSLMSLITGNKVKKKTHKPRYCEKEKDKANKRILRSLSFDNLICNHQSLIKFIILIDQYKYN
jgi:hypothetical protein